MQNPTTLELRHPSPYCIEIWLNRPDVRNAFNETVIAELTQVFQDIARNDQLRVVVLAAHGKAFCAGASFDELMAIENAEQGLTFFSGFAKVINAMRTCGKLVIARVQGKAVGGGVGLASAADYTFATEQASVKLSELAVGIGPFVVGPAVQRKMGLSAFSQLAIDASSFRSATWALQNGLYASVHATIEEMDEAIMQLATILAASSPEAMGDLKRIFWEGTENWDTLLVERAGVSGRLVLSDFTRNAIQQFKAK